MIIDHLLQVMTSQTITTGSPGNESVGSIDLGDEAHAAGQFRDIFAGKRITAWVRIEVVPTAASTAFYIITSSAANLLTAQRAIGYREGVQAQLAIGDILYINASFDDDPSAPAQRYLGLRVDGLAGQTGTFSGGFMLDPPHTKRHVQPYPSNFRVL